ncbi:MAG: class I SAM-dependent methyltransferase [Candidatus Micrarchaeaceae archaeon]|jgi:2-polyprenyl-3-methyl-5-hydroxy-6-metoxy-1,4-benzoquinol methylase
MDENTYFETVLGGLNPDWFIESSNIKHAKYINDVIRFMSKKTQISYHKILDVPCGYGRLEKLLRGYGYEIIGVDINQHYIKEAKRNDREYANNYIRQDMRFLSLEKKFDVVLQWCASFGYYDDSENQTILNNFSKHLNKGGILFLDFPNKQQWIKQTDPRNWSVMDLKTALKLVNSRIVKKGKRTFEISTVQVYKKVGKNLILKKATKHNFRLYTKREMLTMLNKAGFILKYQFSSRTFQKPKISESRSILICVKR